ncbi:septum formation protein Maf [candidate division WOR-1 bacterium RIFOXYC2_FULL_37_10]|uniref:dTTP/UTP pyrophosphatase n=1 Tax=candidate division WOR-1 bacterium RIFOXYB2_FULL_37_13 TaxID=1802579 RepID=A0A1F4SQE6_UNCSA|nr:MAG: septum formation protein Maf [candidate division WOR-1 bacterium RIFOXYB2_FULL_37_13]OGC37387.1 MAG: septum formation protein Maf [candidate division WOR-1 bacterium RIFOXYC2_FULL_37_10]
MNIILASASPRRKQLLEAIIKDFDIVASCIDESEIKAETPILFAVKAAVAKARDVALKYKNSIVIGADTIVILDGKILGKPKSKEEAISMLESLSNTTHDVVTGLAVINSDGLNEQSGYEVAKVTMKELSREEILEYVKSGSPMDKAGSYGVQEIKDKFVKKIEGDYNNIVGLPVNLLIRFLSSLTGNQQSVD